MARPPTLADAIRVSASVQKCAGEAQAKTTVLVVDDDLEFGRLVADLLTDRGYRVVGQATTVGEAIALCGRLEPDAVLLDVMLPDGSGLALAETLCAACDRPNVLLTSTDRMAVRPAQLATSAATGFVAKTQLACTDLEPFLNPGP